uniref:Uncharacterized protein n=1 Tax=Mycena chlorophos TaxID=658473 RepID=A0ABQ0LJL9_MYCCL|nr:predicted protein [Mycena chlorophos]
MVAAPQRSPAYIPVHRRAHAQRTVPMYTVAELLQVADSPLVSVATAAIHEIIKDHELAGFIFNSHQRKRTAEHLRRKHEANRAERSTAASQSQTQGKPAEHQPRHAVVSETKENIQVKTLPVNPATLQRRRVPAGRTNGGNARRSKTFLDAASWRPAATQRLSAVV